MFAILAGNFLNRSRQSVASWSRDTGESDSQLQDPYRQIRYAVYYGETVEALFRRALLLLFIVNWKSLFYRMLSSRCYSDLCSYLF